MTDLEEVKEGVTILEVLAHFGGQGPRSGGWGGWVPVSCPFCADSNGSASVNVPAGRFLCHQCGAPRDGKSGDVIDVAKYGENFMTTKDAIQWLRRTFL